MTARRLGVLFAVVVCWGSSLLAQTVEERVTDLEQRFEELLREGPAARSGLEVEYSRGLVFSDPANPNFTFRIGGRIHNDWAVFAEDRRVEAAFGNIQDGTEFRRARVFFAGRLYDVVAFKAQYDFAGTDADFSDVYIVLEKVPLVGNIRVGQQFEPFGLEGQTSSNYTTFMERSVTTSTFGPGRNTGIIFYRNSADHRFSVSAGVFRDTDSGGDDTDDAAYAYTGRVSYAPVFENDGQQLVHGGVAYSVRNPEDSTVLYDSVPEASLAPNVVSTGSITDVNFVHLVGVEGAVVLGPLSVQGEFVFSHLDRDDNNRDAEFSAAYIFVSYFVTGEHRPYRNGIFGRVRPRRNFGDGEGGKGALELAARWSTVDLDDAGITGGDIDHNVTLGTNWYLNPNTRVMFNYINTQHDLGAIHAAMVRFQIDF